MGEKHLKDEGTANECLLACERGSAKEEQNEKQTENTQRTAVASQSTISVLFDRLTRTEGRYVILSLCLVLDVGLN